MFTEPFPSTGVYSSSTERVEARTHRLGCRTKHGVMLTITEQAGADIENNALGK
jgi:hypothetical protein